MIRNRINRLTTWTSAGCLAGAVLLTICLWSALAQTASGQPRPEQREAAVQDGEPREARRRAAQPRGAHTGELVSAGEDSIAMTMNGEDRHTHRVTPQTRITVNGKPAQISELEPGDQITVATDENNVALRIDAKRQRPQAAERQTQPRNERRDAGEAANGNAWLGVFLEDSEDGGVSIGQTYPGGPADEAGIRPGDRLLQIGGQEVSSPEAASQAVRDMAPDERVELVVLRNGQERTIEVTLGRRNRFLPTRPDSTDGRRSFIHYPDDADHELMFMQHQHMAEQHERIERMLRDLQRQLQEVQNDVRELKAQRNQ